MDLGVLVGAVLLLIASYLDERDRVVVFAVPVSIFVAGVVWNAVYHAFTLHWLAVNVVSAYLFSRFAEYMGWWRRGDTWICTAAVAALPPTINVMTYNYLSVWLYIPAAFATAALYRPLYNDTVPGVHAHTLTYLLIHAAV